MTEQPDDVGPTDLEVLAALVHRKADRKLNRASPSWVTETIEAAERRDNPVLSLVS